MFLTITSKDKWLIPFFLASIMSFIIRANESYPHTLSTSFETEESGGSNIKAPYDLPPGWEHQTNTDNPHFIVVLLSANPRINNIPLQPGDFIGAFYLDDNNQPKCGGADFWLGTENIVFPCFRDDPATPQKDGFVANEIINFRFFSWTTSKEYVVSLVQFDPTQPTTNKWAPLGLSHITNIAAFTVLDIYIHASQNPTCIGNTVTLTATVFIGTTGNYTYSWTSNPPGLVSNQPIVTVTPQVSTYYNLVASDGTNISQHNLLVTVNTPPQILPGENKTICAFQSVNVIAYPSNHSGIQWSTSGDGTFNNASINNPIYMPGPNDRAAGGVTLTATALPKSPCTQIASTNINVTIYSPPTVTLPSNMNVCRGQPVIITAGVTYYSSVNWTTTGDGTFTNPNSVTTQYIPGSYDLSLGYFTLKCCANALPPCSGTSCAQTVVYLSINPTVTSPASRKRCENQSVNLSSSATNYSSILWTTAGDGTFNNPTILSPIYYPGPNDKQNLGTVVTVRAFGIGACQPFPATSNTTIILDPLPRVNPGNTGVFCKGYPLQLNATAQYYQTLTWTTSGDGTFSNPNILNPIYYPGPNDLQNNAFNLTLTATPQLGSACTGSVSAVLAVTLVTGTTAQIQTPPLQNLCVGQPLQLNATATGYTQLLWTTSGDGTFNNPNILNPIYTPGPVIDPSGNPITLTLTAFAPANCGPNAVKTIQVIYSINYATVNAGPDATITEPQSFLTSASASNYSQITWSTRGDGIFSNPNQLITTYTPGISDLQNGSVNLILKAVAAGNCPAISADSLVLTIIRRHVINLNSGWQGFSSFVQPANNNFNNLLQPLSGKLVLARTLTDVYWPEYSINTIQYFQNSTGYFAKLNVPGSFNVLGSDVKPKIVSLSSGWNILPVLSGCNINPQLIVNQLGNKLIILTEIGGNGVIWPQQGINTIPVLLPGRAYMIKLSQQASIGFPLCTSP